MLPASSSSSSTDARRRRDRAKAAIIGGHKDEVNDADEDEGETSALLQQQSKSPPLNSTYSSASSLISFVFSWRSAFLCLAFIVLLQNLLSLFKAGRLTGSNLFLTESLGVATSSSSSLANSNCDDNVYLSNPRALVGAYGTSVRNQYHRPITCKSSSSSTPSSSSTSNDKNKNNNDSDDDIQLLFDQGMMHLYGFNNFEAQRNFQAILLLDRQCAIAFWGLAYSYGPFVNAVLDEKQIVLGRGYINEALQVLNSVSRGSTVSEVEKDMILALDKRFALTAQDWIDNTQEFYDFQYQLVMKELYKKHPLDADIAALYGVVGVDMTRWDYFNRTTKILYPKLDESLLAIEQSLTLTSNKHPLALHLLIHVAEQKLSMTLSRGIAAASALAELVGTEGANHLVHMPGHIYLRAGLYNECIDSGIRATELDKTYASKCLTPYASLHDAAILVSAAMLSGNKDLAQEYSFSVNNTSDYFAVYLSELFPTPIELIMARFGDWKGIVNLQKGEEGEEEDSDSKSQEQMQDSSVESSNNNFARELLLMEVADSIYGRSSSGGGNSAFNMIVGSSSRSASSISRRLLASLMESRPSFMKVMRTYSATLAQIGTRFHSLCVQDGFNRHKCTNRKMKMKDTDISQYAKVELSLSLLAKLVSTVTYDFDSDPVNHKRPVLSKAHVFYPYHREVAELMNATAYSSYFVATGQLERAIPLLERGLKQQQSFNYAEPDHFYLSMAQCLGAIYFDLASSAKEKALTEDFEKYAQLSYNTFLTDLHERPWNGWALRGLINAKQLRVDGEVGGEKNRNIRRKTSVISSDVGLSFSDNSDPNHFVYKKPEDLSLSELRDILAKTWQQDKYARKGGANHDSRSIVGSCCELGYC